MSTSFYCNFCHAAWDRGLVRVPAHVIVTITLKNSNFSAHGKIAVFILYVHVGTGVWSRVPTLGHGPDPVPD